MYTLIGLLISTPFLTKLLYLLTDFEVKLFVIIAIVWNVFQIVIMSDIFGENFGFVGYIISGWLNYYILGYFSDRIIRTKKNIIVIMVIAAICFLITNWQLIYFPSHAVNACDLSPIYTIFTLGLYLFLERVLIIKNNLLKKIIGFIARYTFSVYMIHIIVIQFLSEKTNVFDLLGNMNQYLHYLWCVIITFIISFVLAVVIDNSILKIIKILCSKILDDFFGKLYMRKNKGGNM